jgi:hypothetical protein
MSFIPRLRIRSRYALTLYRDDFARELLTVDDGPRDVLFAAGFTLRGFDFRFIGGGFGYM